MANPARGGNKQSNATNKKQDDAKAKQPTAAHHDGGWRSWVEALVFAFVLAMFVRTFLFELFKIPTGSMIPTLIGGVVADVDVTNDGVKDLVVFQHPSSPQVLAFERTPEGFNPLGPEVLTGGVVSARQQYDRIFVNKFAYWFSPPDRGDVVVFKVPERIFKREKPMYIKRAVGLPGDVIQFDQQGHIVWKNETGEEVDPFLKEHRYLPLATPSSDFYEFPYVDYGGLPGRESVTIEEVRVPEDHIYVLGDNTFSSLDSRYWGAFEADRLKGKAFFRYWPLRQAKFIR